MRSRNIRLILTACCLALLAPLALLISSCGDQASPTASGRGSDVPPPTKTYSTSPESTSELLKDVSDAIKTNYTTNQGVHFTLESSSSGSGAAASARAEGDMVFPDRVKLTSRDYLAAQPVATDLIALGGKVYTRSAATGDEWRSGGAGTAPPPDPQSIANYLDYGRSSRNFGQETLGGGRKTWHVQVDVDTAMMAGDALKSTSDQALRQELEATTTAVVTVDFWIGVDDLLPYQMLVKSSNVAAGSSDESNYIFSDWKETVEITAPCEAC